MLRLRLPALLSPPPRQHVCSSALQLVVQQGRDNRLQSILCLLAHTPNLHTAIHPTRKGHQISPAHVAEQPAVRAMQLTVSTPDGEHIFPIDVSRAGVVWVWAADPAPWT